MADPDLIRPVARATPSPTTSWRSHRRLLPDDLLRDASRRLGVIMSLVAGGLWTLAIGAVASRRAIDDPRQIRDGSG